MSQISESDKSGEKEANDERKPFAVETRQTGGGKNTDCTSTTMMHGGGRIKLWEKAVILEGVLLKSATYLRLKLEQPQTRKRTSYSPDINRNETLVYRLVSIQSD